MNSANNKRSLFRLFFGLSAQVDRKTYAITGVSLMLLKYGVDALVVYYFTGRFFSLLEYLSPLITLRQHALNPAPDWVMMLMALGHYRFSGSAFRCPCGAPLMRAIHPGLECYSLFRR